MKSILLFVSMVALAQQPPARILVSYHSDTGNTETLAQAIRSGAASVAGVEVTLRKTAEVKPDEIVKYDGIVVGTPVHWSNVSAETKRFLDGVGNALWKAKANGDGRTAGLSAPAAPPRWAKTWRDCRFSRRSLPCDSR